MNSTAEKPDARSLGHIFYETYWLKYEDSPPRYAVWETVEMWQREEYERAARAVVDAVDARRKAGVDPFPKDRVKWRQR
jgi:hypothetical protein